MRRDSCSTTGGFIPGNKGFASLNDPRPAAEATSARDYGEPMVAHVNPILPDDTVSGRSLLAVVEVLHFVGARDSFVARTFARHFLAVGLQGGLIGGAVAAALFGLARVLANAFGSFPGSGNAAFFLGYFALNLRGFLWIALVAAAMALVTALASRITVHRTLHAID